MNFSEPGESSVTPSDLANCVPHSSLQNAELRESTAD
jgi:hypothetical protein